MNYRGVAQPGRALGSGPRCRWFKSSRPEFLIRFVARGSWFVVDEKIKIYIYWSNRWGGLF